ncbi:hypothetical protein [Roseateles oligotrophus]|uniref:Meckel syndrome type 1 protein n=1 Tax=Roseateles oligotrophus TaxID=1769250 RepID=A0ABT2YB14_9BURK|nr:hypothetical protein [Roseateles oligotrophus]MCV2367486.1 hypothetical protein [Roseateles oligotrophus]
MFIQSSPRSAPAWPPQIAAKGQPGQLRQCFALALLLHIWLVLMFGNATGTARPGAGVWGRLNVTLAGEQSASGSLAPQPLSALPNGPVGPAKQQRFGGTVRPLEDQSKKTMRPMTPGAAELGAWSERRSDQRAAPPVNAEPPPAEQSQASPALMMAAPAAQTQVKRTLQTPVAGLLASPSQAPTPLDQTPLPQSRVMVMEAAPAATLSRSKPAPMGRVGDELRGLSQQPITPGPLPSLPQFKPVAPPAPKPSAPLPVPVETMAMAAPAPTEEAVPVAVPAEPPKQLAAPLELNRQALREVTALAPASAIQPQAAAAPLAALAASAVAAPSPPAPAPAPVPAQASRTMPPDANAALATPGSMQAAKPGMVPALPQPGAPEAGPRLGVDVATPASTPANQPRLNLNLPRPRGGELSSRGSSGVLQLLPAPPERKSKLTEDLEKAAKDDCRKAYGEKLGLLAVVPLALDAAQANKGCRW